MSYVASDASGGCTGAEKKTSWPEVVGLPAEEAKKIILKDFPEAHVTVIPSGSPMIMNFDNSRVVVTVNTVVQTPTVG
ncbi:hypothetical protein EJB05_34605, partial [Eragrostis curvula]